MPKRRPLAKVRYRAYSQQGGKCYYCLSPIWEGDPASLADTYRIPPRFWPQLRSTAEHLIPWSHGGPDNLSNIVAACHRCNQGRNGFARTPEPDRYREHVARLMARRAWFSPKLHAHLGCV